MSEHGKNAGDLLPTPDMPVQLAVSKVPNAPALKHGPRFMGWTAESKIAYLDKLAASLNQAVGLMQVDRDRLSKIAYHQEEQIKRLQRTLAEQNEMIQKQMDRDNALKESRLQEIVALRTRVRELEKNR